MPKQKQKKRINTFEAFFTRQIMYKIENSRMACDIKVFLFITLKNYDHNF